MGAKRDENTRVAVKHIWSLDCRCLTPLIIDLILYLDFGHKCMKQLYTGWTNTWMRKYLCVQQLIWELRTVAVLPSVLVL